MAAATPGTAVTSANPNTTTNTSLAVALASTTVGDLNVIQLSGLATGTGINPTVTTPAGWAKLFEQMSNSGNPSTFVGVYYRFFQAGDPSSVTFSWANTGQMLADCTPFTGADITTPLPYFTSIPHSSGAGATYTITGTTGTDQGLLVYGAANKTGTAWSGLSDNPNGQVGLSSSATMVSRITAAELAGGTAFTKTMTGSASTIGVQWAFIVKGAAGGTTYAGSAAMTSGSSLGASTAASVAASFGMTSASAMNAATGLTGSSAMTSTSALAGSVTASRPAAVGMTSSSTLTATTATPISAALQATPVFVAHRGGYSATLGEETLEGYRASANQNSKALLEISVWACSTGEYVCSHDSTTGRVFSGTSLTITSSTWAALSGKTSLNGGNQIRRLTDILDDPQLAGRLFVVDNKQDTNHSTLIALLDAHVPGRWMGKAFHSASGTWLAACQNAGAPVWAFYYPADLGSMGADLANLATAKSTVVYGFGDFSAAPVPVQSDSNTFHAFIAANGLKSWAHILGTTTQKSNADTQAATAGRAFDGYMVSGFSTVAPADGGAASMVSASSLTGSTSASLAATSGMTSASSLASSAAATVQAASSWASGSALSSSSTATRPASSSMTSGSALIGSATASLPSSGAMTSSSSMAGTGTLVAAPMSGMTSSSTLGSAASSNLPSTSSMVSASALSAAPAATRPSTSIWASGSTLNEAPASSLPSASSMTSSSSMTGTASANLTAGSAMTSSSSLSGSPGAVLGSSSMVSGSSLGAAATSSLPGSSSWISTSSLSATGARSAPGTAGMASSSTLSSATALAGPTGAGLASGSLLGAAVAGGAAGSSAMTSGSVLGTTGIRSQPADAGMTSQSGLFGQAVAASAGAAGMTSGSTLVAVPLARLAAAAAMQSTSVLAGALQPVGAGVRTCPVRLGEDRWPMRLGEDRWAVRLGGGDVRSATKVFVEVQIKPPIDLAGKQLRFCTNTVNEVPDSPVWQDLVVPEGTVWTPGEWSTVLALVGPGLPVGSLFIIAQITALPEIPVEVAGYREVLA